METAEEIRRGDWRALILRRDDGLLEVRLERWFGPVEEEQLPGYWADKSGVFSKTDDIKIARSLAHTLLTNDAPRFDEHLMRLGFLSFLDRLAVGGGTRSDWENFVVAHYRDARIEEARRELVRCSVQAGDWAWERVPEVLRESARALREGLRSAGLR